MSEIAATFLTFSVTKMERVEREILACVGKLSQEQMWHRGGEHENSVANLLMHLEGNLRQWILHGIDGQPNVRKRDEEFGLEPVGRVAEIQAQFSATLAECRVVIAAQTPERLLARIDPQPGGGWGTPTILEAIYQVVGHLQLHAGQIVLLTKQMTGTDLDLTIPRKR